MASLTYDRKIFDAPDEETARRIILTPEIGQDSEERWERETPYLARIIGQNLGIRRHGLYIDYGCGIGRLAAPLIKEFDCKIIGVDLSERMRAMAPTYVGSQSFSATSPHILHSLVQGGLRVDGAFSVWVFQHVIKPDLDIDLCASALRDDAGLFVLNISARAVPTAEGRWANDGIDVRSLLENRFSRFEAVDLDDTVIPSHTIARSFCGVYRS